MKFCIQCNNMYYLKISSEDSNQLSHYCRNCGYIDNTIQTEGTTILQSHYKEEELNIQHIVNPYTKFDPTLPRIYNIPCPNSACKTNEHDSKTPVEIIYLRYDDANLKYIYLCSTCDTTWKSN